MSSVASLLLGVRETEISPVHHLRAVAGVAPAAIVASTTSSSPPLRTSWNSRSVKPHSVIRRRRRAPAARAAPRAALRSVRRQAPPAADRAQGVAVVVGIGLGTARRGRAGVLVPVPGLLRDGPTVWRGSAPGAGSHTARTLDRAHGVDVLRLRARARASPGRGAGEETFASHRRLPRSRRASEMPSPRTMSRMACTYALATSGARWSVPRSSCDDLDQRHTRHGCNLDQRVLGALDAFRSPPPMWVSFPASSSMCARSIGIVMSVPSSSSTSTDPS